MQNAKKIHNKEIKRIKEKLNLHEREIKEEEAAIKRILKIRTAAAKKAEAAENKRAAKFIADAKREAAAVVASQKKRSAARKSTITAISTGFLAVESAFRRVSAAFNQFVDKLKVLDNFQNLMKRLTGTASSAADSMEFLIDISRRFGLSLQVATERYSKFFAAAKQSGLALEETRAIFSSVAKVSGILGLAGHELSGVFLALEQMLSKGKVTTEELRRQLGERLPGAFGIMAKAVDILNPDLIVTVNNLDDLLKKGEILSAEVLPEFAKQLETAFNALDVVKVETLAAAQSEFYTSITELLFTLEQGQGTVSNFFRGIFDGLTSNIDVIKEWIILQEVSGKERIKLLNLERKAEGLRLQSTIFTSLKEEAIEATKAAEDYKNELINGVKQEQLRVLLISDYVQLTRDSQLENRKLGTLEEERAIAAALALDAEVLSNEELKERIRLLTDANKVRLKGLGLTPGSLDAFDSKISALNNRIKAEATLANFDDKKNQ